jgi:hypothetical protein
VTVAESSKRFRVVQDGWFSGDAVVLRGDAAIARFSYGNWKVQGRISFEDANYEVVQKGGLSNLLRIEQDGGVLCETRIAGMWSRRAELSLDGVVYVVTWPAFDAKTILRRDGVEVGMVGKWKTWKRESEAMFFESVPPLVCILTMWLSTHKRRLDLAG